MNFVEKIIQSFQTDPNKDFLIEVHGKRLEPTKGSEILDAIARARGFIRSAGVKTGDRVALLSPNATLWLAADLAIIFEGAICVPLYFRQEPRQLVTMMKDCAPTLLIVKDEGLESAIRDAWDSPCRIARFEEVFSHEPLTDAKVEASQENPATIIYTSGTSGEPKGVMLSAANADFMLDRVVAEIENKTGERSGDDRIFHYLPFCFAGSRIVLWSQMYRGNPLMMSTDLENLVEEIGTANPHFFLNVPVLLERIKNAVTQKIQEKGGFAQKLYEKAVEINNRGQNGSTDAISASVLFLAKQLIFKKIKNNIGPNLEFLICGSALLSEETQRWFEMIGIPVYQVYGLTETMGIVTIDNPGAVKPGRVGCSVPGCEAKVTEEGELVCRGPNIFIGYYQRPKATREVLVDGWFHTGDKAEMDSDGNIKILGRLKDILVPESGHNIAPEPLEDKLLQADNRIEQAMVVGHGKPYLAAIVTGSIPDSEIDGVLEKVNSDLPHYQRIRRFFHAPTPFTSENEQLTAMQKLRRGAIENHYQQEIKNLYS